MEKSKIYQRIKEHLRLRGASRVAIFGSYSRDQETKDSDIDVLVRFRNPKSLIEIAGIERELTARIRKKIDLVTEKSVSPYMIKGIEKEMIVIE